MIHHHNVILKQLCINSGANYDLKGVTIVKMESKCQIQIIVLCSYIPIYTLRHLKGSHLFLGGHHLYMYFCVCGVRPSGSVLIYDNTRRDCRRGFEILYLHSDMSN